MGAGLGLYGAGIGAGLGALIGGTSQTTIYRMDSPKATRP
jgi:hypothetical protein